MNFSQKLGIFLLIVITVAYIYFSFFTGENYHFPNNNQSGQNSSEIIDYTPDTDEQKPDETTQKHELKNIKIYVTDSKGNLRSVVRKCDTSIEKSCFYFAIKELISAPTSWEKNKGLSSEIPVNTKILSVRESSNNVLIDLSPAFESGGGAESIDIRLRQLIKTVRANSNLPVYLYINGRQADIIGGEGIMIKQPLSEKSLDD